MMEQRGYCREKKTGEGGREGGRGGGQWGGGEDDR